MTTTSRSNLDRFIRRTAAFVQRCWPNNINDIDDLMQEGYLAALEAEAAWDEKRGPFLRYAFVVVRRAMHGAAARAAGTVTTSRIGRSRAVCVQRMRRLGLSDDHVAAQMGVSRVEFNALDRAFRRANPLEPDAASIEHQPYSILDDMLSCSALDNEERALIRLFVEHGFREVARMTAIPTSTLWRKRRAIRRKLMQSGHGL